MQDAFLYLNSSIDGLYKQTCSIRADLDPIYISVQVRQNPDFA